MHHDFDRQFNRAKKTAGIIAFVSCAIFVIIYLAGIAGMLLIFSNPEMVGSFFGRIVTGFMESTK